MQEIFIRDEFIKLGQALKLSGLAESGLDAKELINQGLVKVNGETELRRGNQGEEVIVERKRDDH